MGGSDTGLPHLSNFLPNTVSLAKSETPGERFFGDLSDMALMLHPP
jgi:hypothetical protein